jgi:hypothetical protein
VTRYGHSIAATSEKVTIAARRCPACEWALLTIEMRVHEAVTIPGEEDLISPPTRRHAPCMVTRRASGADSDPPILGVGKSARRKVVSRES